MSIRGQRRSFGKGTTKASAPYKPLRDNKKLPVYIRLADDGDASFVYKSWLDSWWVQNKDQFQPLFYKGHRQVIKRLMENAITVIASEIRGVALVFCRSKRSLFDKTPAARQEALKRSRRVFLAKKIRTPQLI